MRIFLILCLSLFACQAYSQRTVCDSVYQLVDEMPIYKSGLAEFSKDIIKSFQWKPSCGDNYSPVLTWIITAAGEMVDIKIHGFSLECEAEIVNRMKQLRGWRPAKLNGKPVCFRMRTKMCVYVER